MKQTVLPHPVEKRILVTKSWRNLQNQMSGVILYSYNPAYFFMLLILAEAIRELLNGGIGVGRCLLLYLEDVRKRPNKIYILSINIHSISSK